MPGTDAVHVLLAGRAGVYRILQNIMGNEPRAEMLVELSDGSAQEVFRVFAEGHGEYVRSTQALITRAQELASGGAEALDKIDSGFTRLFVGPDTPEATPWESYFLGGERTLFGKITLEVRHAYRQQRLLPAGYPNAADDHIAIELDFLARLAERAEASYVDGESSATVESLAASKKFLQEHTTKWVHLLASKIRESKYSDFYSEAVAVLVAFLDIELEAIDELCDALSEKAVCSE